MAQEQPEPLPTASVTQQEDTSAAGDHIPASIKNFDDIAKQMISMESLSTCYPLLVSITFVLVTFGSVFFFGEHISLQKLIGMAVILGGIVAVSRA